MGRMKIRMLAVFGMAVCLFCGISARAASDVSVEIPVSVSGSNITGPFEIVCEDKYHGTSASLSLRAGESGKFVVTLPAEPDKYECRVYEKAGDDAGAEYDKTVYRVDIHLYYDEKENLRSQVVAYPEGENVKAAACSFFNKKEVSVVNVPQTPSTSLQQVETPRTPLENLIITARQTFDENPVGVLVTAFALFAACGLLLLFGRRKRRNEDEEEE